MKPTLVSLSFIRADNPSNSYFSTAYKVIGLTLTLFYSPLFCVGCLLKYAGSQFPAQVSCDEASLDSIPKTDPRQIEQIYQLLEIFHNTCERENLFYLMDGGTLLGAVRHGGVIPWDDDADVIMKQEEIEQLLNVLYRESNIEISRTAESLQGLYKIRFTQNHLNQLFPEGSAKTAELDICAVVEKEGRLEPVSDFYKKQWPSEWFSLEEAQNKLLYSFGPETGRLSLYGPKNPNSYLERTYGDHCLEYAEHTHYHARFGPFTLPFPILSKRKIAISKDFKICAQGTSSKWNSLFQAREETPLKKLQK